MPRPLNITNLKVEYVTPNRSEDTVNLNKVIEFKFNLDIDTSNIQNVVLIEDSKFEYSANELPSDLSKVKKVRGSFTYKNRTVMFTPMNPLLPGIKYILYIPKKDIKSITNLTMLSDFVVEFYTESFHSIGGVSIKHPTNGSTLNTLDRVEIEGSNVNSVDKYLVQVSKVKTFEVVVYEDVLNSTNGIINIDAILGDGLYFIRVRPINGEYKDPSSFIIRSYEQTSVTDQDVDDFRFDEIIDEECTLVSSFPGGVQVSEKTNIIHLEYDGFLDINSIDFYESGLSYTQYDSDEEENISVDGSFCIVTDEDTGKSHIVFSPVSL